MPEEETTSGALTHEQLEHARRALLEFDHRIEIEEGPPFTEEVEEQLYRQIVTGFSGRDISPSTARSFGYVYTGPSEPEKPFTPNKTDPKKERALATATQKLFNPPRQEREETLEGSRARLYRAKIWQDRQNAKHISELLDSDRPVNLDNLGGRYAELRNVYCPDVIRDPASAKIGWKCSKCADRPDNVFGWMLRGRIYCATCVPDLEYCVGCRCLTVDCVLTPQLEDDPAFVCKECIAEMRCRRCEDRMDTDRASIQFCQNCAENTGSGTSREVSMSRAWLSGTPGEIIKSPRIFSCEIEAGILGEDRRRYIANEIPAEAGMGHDGSIKLPNAFEIQSPLLSGVKGEEFVHQTTRSLHTHKAKVNETCGLHIHLDGAGIVGESRKIYPTSVIQLWKAHLVFEDVVLSVLPYSRRQNDYCRPMRDTFSLLELDHIDSLLDVEKLWYKERTYSRIVEAKEHHRHPSRYFGVNFHSLLSDGHLEIRYHSGTTNPKKILEWANLHSLIMDAAAGRKFNPGFLREAQVTSNLKDKTQMLFNVVGLSKESQAYFRARQRKFTDKKQGESIN
jgi:hypothetical protein